jgi:hypothetical protein
MTTSHTSHLTPAHPFLAILERVPNLSSNPNPMEFS